MSTAQQSGLDSKAALVHTHTTSQISDATSIGKSVLTATDAAAIRTAIGAGTGSSSLVLGTTAGTAKAGDYVPSKTDVGLGSVDNTSDLNKPVSTAVQTVLSGKESSIASGTTAQYYRGDKTWQTLDKTSAGLANVDNTSDINKPISTATQNGLNTKEPSVTSGTVGQYYRGDKSWQTLDKTAVGLSNVDNTSDLNKPISTATQTALSSKADAASIGAKILLIDNAASLPAGTPAGVIVVVKA
ncbi:MAG: hypothetical protein ABIQ04_03540 [Candidatus Saccharimonadales bacterium]